MKTKILALMLSASALALAVTVTPQPAQARGGAVAAGIIGGLAVGAIVGSQLNNNYYGGPGYYGGPYGGPGYYQAPYQPVYGACHYERERVTDHFGHVHTRRVRVCD
jgi:hypothetical protein